MLSTTRAARYASLVATYGAGAVADRLLTKWLTDPDAEHRWERLQQAVARAGAPKPDRTTWRVQLPPQKIKLPRQTNAPLLNRREVSVLEAAANGLSARATAERAYRSRNSILWYRSRIIRKLGARNITHAVALYWRAAS